jgi:hypothetical protein
MPWGMRKLKLHCAACRHLALAATPPTLQPPMACQLRLPVEAEGFNELDFVTCLCHAVPIEHVESVWLCEDLVAHSTILKVFAVLNSPADLRHMLDNSFGLGFNTDLTDLCRLAAESNSACSVRVSLEYGAPRDPPGQPYANQDNQEVSVLDVALNHSKIWCPHVPSVAAFAGNAHFLSRVFDAGCPTWETAQDGEPYRVWNKDMPIWSMYLRGPEDGNNRGIRIKDWSLVVSSDLVCSGPVLLLAAQKNAPLTPRMQRMLDDVRRRVQSLALCFHRAARLSQGQGAAAQKWDSMGRVPFEIVQNIATLARISIVAKDYVE